MSDNKLLNLIFINNNDEEKEKFKKIIPSCKTNNCQSLHVDKLVENILANDLSETILLYFVSLRHSTQSEKRKKILSSIKIIEKELLRKVAKNQLKFLIALNLGTTSSDKNIFEDENCLLRDFEKKVEEMTTNNFLSSKKIQATIDAHIHHLEKETGEKKKIDYKKNDVANILFKDTSYQAFGINCCARYDDEKNNINDILSSQYLLAPCPKDLYQVGDLFQLALSGSDDNNINCKSKLMVSVFTRGEKEKVKYVDNYWEEEVLKNIPLRYGWYYLYSTEEKKQEKEKEKEKVVASLTERKIIFQNARDGRRKEITHLHLNGWLDQTQCEDEDLLIQLVERIETLTAPTVSIDDENSKHQARSENKESNRSTQTLTSPKRAQPFILGCIHSRSRSATVLLIHLVRQEIRKKLSNYCSHSSPSSQLPVLEDISINIPEIIFKLRQQRLEFMRRPCQMVNLYSVTNYFCRQLFEARNYLREVFSETELSENKFSETKETKETRKKDEEKIVSNILSFL